MPWIQLHFFGCRVCLLCFFFFFLGFLPLRSRGIYYRSRLDPIDIWERSSRDSFSVDVLLASARALAGSRGACSIVWQGHRPSIAANEIAGEWKRRDSKTVFRARPNEFWVSFQSLKPIAHCISNALAVGMNKTGYLCECICVVVNEAPPKPADVVIRGSKEGVFWVDVAIQNSKTAPRCHLGDKGTTCFHCECKHLSVWCLQWRCWDSHGHYKYAYALAYRRFEKWVHNKWHRCMRR
jgi:hypothetical protein